MVASGNDFVIVDSGFRVQGSGFRRQGTGYSLLARNICDRKYGVGADGLLVLKKSKLVNMRIFNADGSEAEMCGNGARCAAYYIRSKVEGRRSKVKIETRAGIIEAEVSDKTVKIKTKAGIIEAVVSVDNVKIRLTDPKDLRLNIPLKLGSRVIKVNFINSGVPHAVVFVEGMDKIDVFNLGRAIRNHKEFAPRGTNVDFVEVLGNDTIKVRTYERGVEDETLACGTGSVASALVASLKSPDISHRKIDVQTKSGEVLKVYFDRAGCNFKNVWLEGKAQVVYKGEFIV